MSIVHIEVLVDDAQATDLITSDLLPNIGLVAAAIARGILEVQREVLITHPDTEANIALLYVEKGNVLTAHVEPIRGFRT